MHKKTAWKFCSQKTAKKRKTHPKSSKRAKPGAFWVLERGCGRCGEVDKPKIRTNVNHITVQHMQKGNRRKPSVFAGFVAGAEGLVSPAGSVGPGRSPPGCRPPRHAPQASLRAHLAAKSYRTLTKKSGTAKAIPDFLAGAEGLEPSARGFGVDVETAHREWGRGGVARSPRSSPQRAVLIWCYEESEVEKACRAISFSSPTTISFCLYRATGVGNEITTC